MNDWRVRFALANLAAVAWTVAAFWQAPFANDVTASIVRRYLPFALVLAAIGTLLLASHQAEPRRTRFVLRHFAVYAAVPLLLFVQSRSAELRPAVAGTIYVAAFFGWAIHGMEGLLKANAISDRRNAALLGSILLFLFLAIMPYHRAVMPTASDEPHYLVIMQSVLYDRTLDLKNTYDTKAYLAFHPDELPDRHVIHVGEAEFPIRDLGLPFIALPAFALAGRTGVLALMCVVGALLGALLYLVCRDVGIPRRAALLGVFAGMATHPLLTYTSQVYPELLVALALVVCARLLRRGRDTALLELALASAALGTMPWLSTRAWFVAVGAGIVVAYVALRPRIPVTTAARVARVVVAAAPFAVMVLLLCLLNYRMFGWFIPSAGYLLIRDQQEIASYTPQIGVPGLLFDRAFGLVPRTPIYLLAALGVVPLLRRVRTPQLAALALGWLFSFVYIADIVYWWADGAPPSRYLVGVLPFFVVLVAAGIAWLVQSSWPAMLARAVAWGIAAYSLAIAYVYAVLPNLGYDLAVDIRASDSNGSLFDFLGRTLRPNPGVLFPSMVHARVADYVLAVLWLAVVFAAVAVAARFDYWEKTAQSSGRTWTQV